MAYSCSTNPFDISFSSGRHFSVWKGTAWHPVFIIVHSIGISIMNYIYSSYFGIIVIYVIHACCRFSCYCWLFLTDFEVATPILAAMTSLSYFSYSYCVWINLTSRYSHNSLSEDMRVNHLRCNGALLLAK